MCQIDLHAHLLILRKNPPCTALFWSARLFRPTHLFGTLEYPFIKFEEKISAYPFIRASSSIRDLRVQQRKQIRADLYTLLYLLQLEM